MRPRFNFSSVILGSKLVLAGGIGNNFKLAKDYQEIELDQTKIRKRIPNSKPTNGGKSKENLSKSRLQSVERLPQSNLWSIKTLNDKQDWLNLLILNNFILKVLRCRWSV